MRTSESSGRLLPRRVFLPVVLLATALLGAACCADVRADTADSAASPSPLRPDADTIYVGVDYYPEHWPEQRWATDLRLMREADFNVVRVGEFAWGMFEPTEGVYEFGWLDRFLDLAHRNGVRVILGTPSAVMPAWLARRYPDALATQADGTRIVWGGRRHNCFSSPAYLSAAERMTTKMAERYADHPAVIGWQIDNELGGTDCRCEKCRVGFQQWLRAKYGTLDALHEAWGSRFWGLLFSDWADIPIPDDRTREWAISNPSASLDWMRYTSGLNVGFLNRHTAIVRDACPRSHFVTHNLMGLHSGIDYFDLAEKLDFVSWDNYPTLSPDLPYDSSLAADLMRGLKKKPFLIMEQTAGPLGWSVFSRSPQPGELRSICYQQLAHGADGQVWFRWRTCTVGREQYWHGLLGHDGKTGRRYREASRVAKEYRKLAPALLGTTPQNDVAILYDYASIWALQIQQGYPGASHQEAIKRYYRALQRAGVGVDVVKPGEDLAGYRLVIAPHLHVMPDALAEQLAAYVKNGGTLLTDCRTGVKDQHNLAHERTLPGLLGPTLGIEIHEYESLRLGIAGDAETKYCLTSTELDVNGAVVEKYADWITPTTARRMAGYDQKPLAEYAAITRNESGSGVGWYVGAVVTDPGFYDTLVAKLLADSDIDPIVRPPHGVEAAVRSNATDRLLFLINHTDQIQKVAVPAGRRELLTDKTTGDAVELEAFGVAVIAL